MAIKVAINGFGRVGRYLVRACIGCGELDIVAINSRAKPDNLAHLLKYDSVHGKCCVDVKTEDNYLVVDGKKILITQVTSPLSDLPWKKMSVDIVLESTGKFRKRDDAAGHLAAGAKKVILAVPGKGIDGTFVMGVNEETYDPRKHHIISNASCTTNCLAPVAKVLHDEFTIVKGLMTTVHSYTMDQRLLDGSHKDVRRGRAAALSIVPTSTGAAKAVTEVIPALKGKLDGVALRVPTPNVSLVDLAVEVGRNVTIQEVNGALKAAAKGRLKGIMEITEEELVSVDFIGSPLSAIVDAPLTAVIGGNFVKVFAWYDNESGYACRMEGFWPRTSAASRLERNMIRPVVAGNWKMNKTVHEAVAFVTSLLAAYPGTAPYREVIIAPPFTAIHAVADVIRGSFIRLAAQNLHEAEQGAFTGEISGRMLCEAGCTYVIVGHSERRALFNEGDALINRKLRTALGAGLRSIFCVGESLRQREASQTETVIESQLNEGLNNLTANDIGNLLIAYEPVWAIGTGKTATPAQAEEVHRFIREWIARRYGPERAEITAILYGGSVTPKNIAELIAQPDVNGALVGGASLECDTFIQIIGS